MAAVWRRILEGGFAQGILRRVGVTSERRLQEVLDLQRVALCAHLFRNGSVDQRLLMQVGVATVSTGLFVCCHLRCHRE